MPSYALFLERTIAAPVDRVYDAWLTPEVLRAFMKPKPYVRVADVVVAPAVGGDFRILMHGSGREELHKGTYQILDRPRVVSFRWASESSGPNTVVTVLLTTAGPATTQVSLRHERFDTAAARDNHQEGWRNILDNLARVLEKDVGPR